MRARVIDDNSWIDVEEKNGDVVIMRKEQVSEDDYDIIWKHIIDPRNLDLYLGHQLGLSRPMIENEGVLIIDISKISDEEWLFKTEQGDCKVSLDQLQKIVNFE